MKIYVTRHGQDEDNARGIFNGHRDFPLTELGRQQAKKLGDRVKKEDLVFDEVYCSPLKRAQETAQIVSEVAGLPPPQVLDDLIERDFGAMTGLTVRDVEKMSGVDAITTPTATYFLNVEDSETFPQLMKRARLVIDELRTNHSGKNILLVCHRDIGEMLYAVATETDWREVLEKVYIDNGELVEIAGKTD